MKILIHWLVGVGVCLAGWGSSAPAENNGVHIEMVNSYPELRVDGQPFLIHSAAFSYPRLPRDLWLKSLLKYRELGINTLDLYLPWNWHEPQEGQFDFDGHSNPRRDLQGLLKLISEQGFKLIVRPGPVILNEWKNGGYPDWLLLRPEYKESLQDVLEGRYPRLSSLSPSQSEDASRQWLENSTHLRYTRQWFFNVMKVLSPYLPSQGGNILFFQLDDDQAINRANYNGPKFWSYMEALRQDLAEAAISAGGRADDVFPFINPTDMRVSAAGFDPALPHAIAAMGQWYMNSGSMNLSFADSTELQFFVEELKTQPQFPPMIIEFQAGWYVPGDDIFARPTAPENTLLASRTLMAHGLRGLNYFPLQDTLYPAGYAVPWTSHYYTWEAALDLNSNSQPRSLYVHRNGNLIQGLGRWLAQTHKQADVGIVYSLGAFQPQEKLTREDVRKISENTIALQKYCLLNQVSDEYVDPAYQTVEQLQRHRVLLMPTFEFEPDRGMSLNPRAVNRLVEFVEKGGTLIFFPKAPVGGMLGNWFSGLKKRSWAGRQSRTIVFAGKDNSPVPASGEIESYEAFDPQADSGETVHPFARMTSSEGGAVVGVERRVKAGRVLALGMDFYSWAAARVEKNVAAAAAPAFQPENQAKISPQNPGVPDHLNFVIDALLGQVDVSRKLRWSEQGSPGQDRTVDVQIEAADACSGFGFISLANFSTDSPRDVKFSMSGKNPCLAPVNLPAVHVLPQDALWLPLHLPLRFFLGNETAGEIVGSSAELVSVQGASDHFVMELYSTPSAEIILKLPDASRWRFTEGQTTLMTSLESREGVIRISIPASSGGSLTRQIDAERASTSPPAGKTPEMASESRKPGGSRNGKLPAAGDLPGLEVSLHSNYMLPIRNGLSLPVNPPILVLDASAPSKFLLHVKNPSPRSMSLSIEIKVEGYRLTPSLKKISVRPQSEEFYEFSMYLFIKGAVNPSGKVAEGEFILKSHQEKIVKKFSLVTIDRGSAMAYAIDLDRDGAPEVVLENSELRLIVTPHAGARAFVLYDKRAQRNFFTSAGAFRDKFQLNSNQPAWKLPRQIRGYYGLFNRPYRFEILVSGGSTAMARFSYDAPDVAPGGVRIQKTITLHGSEGFFEVEYEITPHQIVASVSQGFITSTSVIKPGFEGPSAISLEPFGPAAQLLERTERIPRDFSGEILMHFKAFQEGIPNRGYRILYRLPLENSGF